MRRILYVHTEERLLSLSEACLSLTPKICALGQEIFLEIGCTSHLFGGEKQILFNTHRLLDSFGLSPYLVLTDRPEWARALATEKEVILPPGKSQERLLSLPIERLVHCGDPVHLDKEGKARKDLIRFMKRVGMHTIQNFAKLSPLAINRRFGKLGVLLHQSVLGEREITLPPFVPADRICEKIETEEIPSLEILLHHLEKPLLQIALRLQGRGLSAKSFRLQFRLESGLAIQRTLSLTEPKQEAHAFQRLFKECFDSLYWDSPLTSLEIEVRETVRYQRGQLSLFDNKEEKFAELAEYVGRLRAKFGDEAVGFPVIQPSFLPEKSWKNHWPPDAPKTDEGDENYPIPNRPLFVYLPPQKLTPERNWKLLPSEMLSTEWWEGGGNRKYFIAETSRGTHLWIFWDYDKKGWFLQGTFD
jgi:protein ImuB